MWIRVTPTDGHIHSPSVCAAGRRIKLSMKLTALASPVFIFPTSLNPKPPSKSISMAAKFPKEAEATPKRVVVCGGGVIGVCAAYFLAERGASVTLIEKSSVACAASGKAGGFLALDWCDGGPLADLARASFNLHRSLARDLDGARIYGYRPLRTLSLSFQESVDPTPPSRSKKGSGPVPPWVDGPVRAPVRTIGTVETTAQVHPQLFTRALLAAAVDRHGVEVVIGEVDQVWVEDGKAVGVEVKDGENRVRVVPASSVVLALGPWSSRLALISSLFGVSGLKAHSIVLRPQSDVVITADALFLRYSPAAGGKPLDPEVYPRPNGEVYICGMSEENAVIPEDPEQVTGNPESISMLHKVAETVSSCLRRGEAQVQAEQACFLPCTADGLPVIGEIPNVKGCYVATGHNCWGILNGPATGAALAELIMDGQATLVDLTPFSPARFIHRLTK